MSAPELVNGERPWAELWRGMLDEAGASAARRVQRGQALARRGAVGELSIGPGRIEAAVHEGRSHPDRVTLRCPVASDERWTEVATTLARELRFTAALLDGIVPNALAAALADEGIVLVPALEDLDTSCTCAERAALCRHVVAVHDAAAVLIGRTPTLLLRLAGRDVEHLLRDLRAPGRDGEPTGVATLDLSRGLTEAHGDLDAIDLRPAPVSDPGALLRHLGDPPFVDDALPVERLVERAAETAWRLAAGDGSDAADQEVLLAELRAQRVAGAADLAAALGRDAEEVREELDELFEAGTVMRMGSGTGARYRAAGG
ncbi:MAG: hypothetical protein JJT89_16995 [Nitriliruptoraceae bacterium]|nr:hypothetical protein [Nitriliruptoraceae bacterium]